MSGPDLYRTCRRPALQHMISDAGLQPMWRCASTTGPSERFPRGVAARRPAQLTMLARTSSMPALAASSCSASRSPAAASSACFFSASVSANTMCPAAAPASWPCGAPAGLGLGSAAQCRAYRTLHQVPKSLHSVLACTGGRRDLRTPAISGRAVAEWMGLRTREQEAARALRDRSAVVVSAGCS